MWRVEYIGENPYLFGKEGWADATNDPWRIKVKFDGQTEWKEYDHSDFESSEFSR